MGSYFRNFPQSHSWRSDVPGGHLTMDCQLHSHLHVSITEPGRWACANLLDLCRHLLGWFSVHSLAASGNKGPGARGDRADLGELSRIPTKLYENTCYPAPGFRQDRYKDPREAASNLQLSRRFLEANGGIVDHWSCPEANAEDKPKCDVEKCQAATQSSVVSDAPNDHRHYGSPNDSRSQNT